MAQKRLRDYQSQLGSFLHNLINLGVHYPGRFCGFSSLQITGQTQFSLLHGGGINTFDSLGNPYGPLGVAMSVQGEIIIEDGPVPGLNMTPNNGTTDRIDLIVMNHQYILVSGGGDATYSVIQGNAPGQPYPALGPFQVLLAYLTVPAGNQGVTGCQYTKVACQDSGDSPDAKLTTPNIFGALQAEVMSPLPFNFPTATDGLGISLYDLPAIGNSFAFTPTAALNIDGIRITNIQKVQDGMKIDLLINRFCTVRGAAVPQDPSTVYEPILFSSRLANGSVTINQAVYQTFTPPNDENAVWVLGLIRYNGKWIVRSVDGPGFSTNSFLSGMTIAVDMPILQVPNNFDAFGLGTGAWTGWQIANGIRSQDYRGRFPVGATDVPAQGQPAVLSGLLPPGTSKLSQGSFGGSAKMNITQSMLPAIGLRLLTNATNGTSPWFVQDTGGGGSNFSLKGDSDNSLGNGYIYTENMGSGAAFAMMPAYIVTMWVTKL